MHVQEVPPRPFDPLVTLDEDYAAAVLHLAWARFDAVAEPRLLFALVELLPTEMPPPLDDGEQVERIGEHGTSSLHVRRYVVPAREAIAWYLECRRGIAIVPAENGTLSSADDTAGMRFTLADLGEEPAWPMLVCTYDEDLASSTIPFCPPWHVTPRVHHLVPLTDLSLEKLWPDENDRAHVTRWLSGRFHFRFDDYPEYWGSLHLVAPNPVYRRLEQRLVVTRDPPSEAVFLHFEPRIDKSVEGLELLYTESHPWGTRDIRRIVVQGPFLRVGFEHRHDTTQRTVVDLQRGLLENDGGGRVFLGSRADFPKLASAIHRIWSGRNLREKRHESTKESAK